MDESDLIKLFKESNFTYVEKDSNNSILYKCPCGHNNSSNKLNHLRLQIIKKTLKCTTCDCKSVFANRMRKIFEKLFDTIFSINENKKQSESYTFVSKAGYCLMIYVSDDNILSQIGNEYKTLCEGFIEFVNIPDTVTQSVIKKNLIFIKLYETRKKDILPEIYSGLKIYAEYFPEYIRNRIMTVPKKLERTGNKKPKKQFLDNNTSHKTPYPKSSIGNIVKNGDLCIENYCL